MINRNTLLCKEMWSIQFGSCLKHVIKCYSHFSGWLIQVFIGRYQQVVSVPINHCVVFSEVISMFLWDWDEWEVMVSKPLLPSTSLRNSTTTARQPSTARPPCLGNIYSHHALQVSLIYKGSMAGCNYFTAFACKMFGFCSFCVGTGGSPPERYHQ